MEQLLKLDALQVELGYALVHLADQSKKGDLLRVTESGKILPVKWGWSSHPSKSKTICSFRGKNTACFSRAKNTLEGDSC